MKLFGFDTDESINQLFQNFQDLKKDLTWTPLPSGSEVWEQGKKNGDKMKEEIKQKGAEMATDLLPAGGGLAGVIKSSSFVKEFPEYVASKFKDEAGDLKVLYHGTSKDVDFKEFKKSPRGTWLTTDPKSASSYAVDNDSMGVVYDAGKYVDKNTASRVIPVYVNANKLYKLSEEELGQYKKATNYSKFQKEITAKAEREGYEAIDWGYGVYSVIDPKSIKSAISPTLPKKGKKASKEVDDFFGMHKSTDLGDVLLTKSAKDPSKFQMTLFDGKLGSSNTVKDMQFNTKEEAMKAFEEQ